MSVLAAAGAFAVGTVFVAGAQTAGDVEVSVSTQMVGITVTGGDVDFGGPHPGNVPLYAHPNPAATHTAYAHPTVQNSGNVAITSLSVEFTGDVGAEGTCDGGDGSWSATSATAGVDTFWLKVLASASTDVSNLEGSAKVAPGTGSGDILQPSSLSSGSTIPLYLNLRTPTAATTGAEGCSIGLTVTASAG
jgi:hypothetical protein